MEKDTEINDLIDNFAAKIDLVNPVENDITKDDDINRTASEHDDCKNDAGFINELYQRLVSKEEEDVDVTENPIFQQREEESSIESKLLTSLLSV